MENKLPTIEDFIKILNSHGIETTIENFRNIKFNINFVDYTIEWFINESTLSIGSSIHAPFIKFKYIFHDRTYPLIGGNNSLAFSYVKFKKESIFDREYPYEVFRIPLNKDK